MKAKEFFSQYIPTHEKTVDFTLDTASDIAEQYVQHRMSSLKMDIQKAIEERRLLKALVKLDGVRYGHLKVRIFEIKMLINSVY